jgi:hypothetical protein
MEPLLKPGLREDHPMDTRKGGAMGEKGEDEVIPDFDQTNGIVSGLEGDDGGALPTRDEKEEDLPESFFNRVVSRAAGEYAGPDKGDDEGVTPYSEEGRP